ncbi:hypothetical protein H0E85_05070 [Lactiplantibacillus plantarum]|uniref:hypothetical protein n=1 Tax=Lactiplantibacillus plantarum TaxID=1590 RepID=UPI0015EB709B|nr:hypothetical protein [Lactiplantibacillus plantarum]QLQ50966.1 hypothetical protein H0E85_05070 [Lactiplantibacillus plantarum]
MISTITLDTYKQKISSADAFNLSDSFNGRVGDEQVPLVVHFKERGLAQRFQDGLVPFLTGFVGSLDENDQVTAETGEAVSYVGTSDDIVGLGRAKMNLPGTMFPQEGYFYGFLGLQNADGKRVTTFNVWFHVYNGNPDMFVNKAPFRTELQKFLDELQGRIDDADGTLNDWKQKVSDLFTKLSNQGVDTQTLLTTLEQQIKADGLLTQGALDKALNQFEDHFASLQSKVDASVASATTFANAHRLGQKYHVQGTTGSTAQGFAGLGGTTVVQYYQNFSPLDVQYGTLTKFNVETGDEILSNEIKGYHGNSMTYNATDGFLYLAMAEDTSGTETAQKTKVLQIDPATLTIKDTIDLTAKTALPVIHSIGYDSTDGCYVVTDNKTLEFYDSSWDLQFTIKWSDLIGYDPWYMQGVQIHGTDLYWIGGRKSQIWAYTIDYANKTLAYRTTYTFDAFQEGLYPTGEIEGMAFNDNGQIYLASAVNIGGWGGLAQYFTTNSNFKVPVSGSMVVAIQNADPRTTDFFVGKNSAYNPDGTYDNPFASLLEASVCLRTPATAVKQLTFLNDMSDETLPLVNISNAMVKTQGYSIKAAVIINCNNLYFDGLKADGYSRYKMNALYVLNSNIRINGWKCADLSTNTDITEDIHIERSQVYLQDNSKSRIGLYNSTFDSAGSTYHLVKQNSMAQTFSNQVLGTINDIANSDQLSVKDFTYYTKMNAAITVNMSGTTFGFNLSAPITAGTVSLVGFTQVQDIIYLCAFHYVDMNPQNTTLEFFSLPAFTKVTPASYSITATVSDR